MRAPSGYLLRNYIICNTVHQFNLAAIKRFEGCEY